MSDVVFTACPAALRLAKARKLGDCRHNFFKIFKHNTVSLTVYHESNLLAEIQSVACCCCCACHSSGGIQHRGFSGFVLCRWCCWLAPRRPDDSMVFPNAVTSQDTRPSVRFSFQLRPPHPPQEFTLSLTQESTSSLIPLNWSYWIFSLIQVKDCADPRFIYLFMTYICGPSPPVCEGKKSPL